MKDQDACKEQASAPLCFAPQRRVKAKAAKHRSILEYGTFAPPRFALPGATVRRCIAALQGAFSAQHELASHGGIHDGDLFIIDQEDL